MSGANDTLKNRLRRRAPLIGCWVRTPAPVVCELLGSTRLDTVCLDGEHGPFDRQALDGCLAMLRALGKPGLVRVASKQSHHILSALDAGATGVVVPHVTSAADAETIAKAAHFGPGGRGYAGNTRWAALGTGTLAANLDRGRRETVAIAQIEDVDGVEAIDAIAAVDGLDALFIGRMDLTVALGHTDPDHPEVIDAVDHVCAAAQRTGRALGMFVPRLDAVGRWLDRGIHFYLLSSDQAFIRAGAEALAQDFHNQTGAG